MRITQFFSKLLNELKIVCYVISVILITFGAVFFIYLESNTVNIFIDPIIDQIVPSLFHPLIEMWSRFGIIKQIMNTKLSKLVFIPFLTPIRDNILSSVSSKTRLYLSICYIWFVK